MTAGLRSLGPSRKGGDLSERHRARRRAWFLANVLITVALLPALFPERDGDVAQVLAGAVRDPGAAASDEAAAALALDEATAAISPPPTTTPTTMVTTTTTIMAPPVRPVAPARAPTTTTTTTAPARPSTTTTAPPPPPPALEEPAPGATSQQGYATWYHGAGDGHCAHRSLPFGTVVTVTTASGASTRCTVGDRGPFVAGYVIDLSQVEFQALAPLSVGRLSVTLTW